MSSRITPWILATRPRTLPAAIGPLLVGNVLAMPLAHFSAFIAIISIICGVLLQVAVNLANDYFDFKSGVDTDERLGPVRVTQSGLLKPESVRNGMILCLTLAVAVGSLLISHGGWPIVFLALFSVLGAIGYSGGPYPLASHGLGEVAAFVFFGLVTVVGSFYLQSGMASSSAWLLGSAIGFLNAAIMLVNNTRDIQTDTKANKKTLAVRVGESQAKVIYQSFLHLPYAIIVGGFLMGLLPGIPVLLTSLSLLIARKLANEFTENTGAALNPILGKTAKLTLIFSLLFSLGLLIEYYS